MENAHLILSQIQSEDANGWSQLNINNQQSMSQKGRK
jgi:hypothetical protein